MREVEHHPSNNPTDRLNNPSQFPVRRHRERVTSLADHATTKTTSLSDFGGAASGESNDGGGRRATDDRYLLLVGEHQKRNEQPRTRNASFTCYLMSRRKGSQRWREEDVGTDVLASSTIQLVVRNVVLPVPGGVRAPLTSRAGASVHGRGERRRVGRDPGFSQARQPLRPLQRRPEYRRQGYRDARVHQGCVPLRPILHQESMHI